MSNPDGVVRMTMPTRAVLAALLADPSAETYGMALMVATDLPSGTLYPILNRLRAHGWITYRWEDRDPHQSGRPQRRYIKLTDEGAHKATAALERRRNKR
jgi:DNA-binding PadR family transcriptional regulator